MEKRIRDTCYNDPRYINVVKLQRNVQISTKKSTGKQPDNPKRMTHINAHIKNLTKTPYKSIKTKKIIENSRR